MAYRDGEAPRWNWVIYSNADARFAFDVGYNDDDGNFVLSPDADNNQYSLTIAGPSDVYSSYVYSTSANLPIENSRVSVHLSPDMTYQYSPHTRYQYRIDEVVPSGDRTPVLVGNLYVRAGA